MERGAGRSRQWILMTISAIVLVVVASVVTVAARHTTRASASQPAALVPTAMPSQLPPVAATPAPAAATSAASAASVSPPASVPTKAVTPRPVIKPGVSLDDPHASLGAIATPSWAQEPPTTTILHSSLSRINIYNYAKGQAPSATNGVLITLNNPTLEDLTFTLAGFGETDGFYLALLDVRPNQTFGWVKASDVSVSTTPYRIEISQTQHRLLLWKTDTVIGNFAVAVGKPSTPTPDGYFFVNTVLKQSNPAGAYGPWIVSSSGFSEVYTTFDDGDAAIGLHGSDEPLLIGQSISHGCIRMYNSDIPLIANTVPVGTLFSIHQ